MSTIEKDKTELLAVHGKLTDTRKELKDANATINDLRNQVVTLQDKSITDKQAAELAAVKDDLKVSEAALAEALRQLSQATRDIAADQPARELLAALKKALG